MVKNELEDFIRGDEIDKIKDFRTFKKIMILMLKGYPKRIYWGIFEGYEKKYGEEIIKVLEDHDIIDIFDHRINGKLTKCYRLTSKGVSLAISLINLDHSEKTLNFSKRTDIFNENTQKLTLLIIILTIATVLFDAAEFFIKIFNIKP